MTDGRTQTAPVALFAKEQAALLQRLAHLFADAGDATRVRKLETLREKWERSETAMVFTGHFSAGKSTLINALLRQAVLPASPLPTSANAVRISFGAAQAHARMMNGDSLTLPDLSENALSELKEWCRAGDDVASVEIATPAALLQEGLVLYDTPGVDSTDERHAAQTDDVLFAADAVIFVADYHHVMSDINFHFMRRLVDEGKPIWLVVSQMDKHNEWEMPLATFEQSVLDALSSWQIACEQVSFVAAKEASDPGLCSLRDKLRAQAVADLPAPAITSALTRLLNEHGRWLSVRAGESDEQIEAARALFAKREQQAATRGAREAERLTAIADFAEELRAITTQAILLPYETTELAVLYIESLHPQFRVGFLSSAKRVAAVREERLQTFAQALQERTHDHIGRHLLQALLRTARAQGWSLDFAQEALETALAQVDESFVAAQVATGAGLDRAYGYAYAKHVDEAVRQIFLRFISVVVEALQSAGSERESAADELAVTPELDALASRIRLRESRLEHLRHEAQTVFTSDLRRAPVSARVEIRAMATDDETRAGNDPSPSHRVTLPIVGSLGSPFAALDQALPDPTRAYSVDAVASEASLTLSTRRTDLINRLQIAIGLCDEPVLRRFLRALTERLTRLLEEQYTVALFGAFSAGKSTLVNALLGGDILPVSPNPATAAISRVLPPTKDTPHKTVRVLYKSASDLTAEVEAACTALSIPAVQPDALSTALAALKDVQVGGERVAHHTFLQAVARGWDLLGERLGTEETLLADDFAAAVATEERAAFAERIDLYYASPFAEAGIILVDTPGADSINARHTDVSFRYLRDADAVLFVTYYNHAFSKADREFLEQVGRVKDALAYDSLHVVINAIDLAQNADEVAQVQAYVVRELGRAGVRAPRVYPVSSQLGVLAQLLVATPNEEAVSQTIRRRLRLSNEATLPAPDAIWRMSGVQGLVEEVLAHTRGRLLSQTLSAGEDELSRIREYLAKRLEERRVMAADANRMNEVWSAACAQWQSQWITPSQQEIEGLRQEISELFYHIHQRFTFAQNDLLLKAYHPSWLESGTTDQVERSVAEWLRLVGLHLGQEARATVIRVNRYARDLAAAWCARSADALAQSLPFTPAAPPLSASPDLVPAIPAFTSEALRGRIAQMVKRHFRQADQFYERGGRKQLGVELEPLAKELAHEYLDFVQQSFMDTYGQWLKKACEAWRDAQSTELIEAIDAEVQSLRDPEVAIRLAQVMEKFPAAQIG